MGRRTLDELDHRCLRWATRQRQRLGLVTPGDERRYVADLALPAPPVDENTTDAGADLMTRAVEAIPEQLRGIFMAHYVARHIRPGERVELLGVSTPSYYTAVAEVRAWLTGFLRGADDAA